MGPNYFVTIIPHYCNDGGRWYLFGEPLIYMLAVFCDL